MGGGEACNGRKWLKRVAQNKRRRIKKEVNTAETHTVRHKTDKDFGGCLEGGMFVVWEGGDGGLFY